MQWVLLGKWTGVCKNVNAAPRYPAHESKLKVD